MYIIFLFSTVLVASLKCYECDLAKFEKEHEEYKERPFREYPNCFTSDGCYGEVKECTEPHGACSVATIGKLYSIMDM